MYYMYNSAYVKEQLPSGYLLLSHFANSISLDYTQFRICVGVTGLLLTAYFILHYSNSPNFIFSIYLIFPFLLDVIQLRFFLAISIALIGISILLDSQKVSSVLVFIIVILIASTIHTAALCLLICLTLVLPDKWCYRISISTSIVILVSIVSGLAQKVAIMFVSPEKAMRYFSVLSRFASLKYIVPVTALILLCLSINNEVQRDEALAIKLERFRPFNIVTILKKYIYALLPLISLTILSPDEFFRPLRTMLLILYIYITNVSFSGLLSKQARSIALVLLLVFISIISIVGYSINWNGIQEVLFYNFVL